VSEDARLKVFVVYAHPEPRSFGRALLDRGTAELRGAGHEVAVSDLYAMGFNPVASAADFTVRRFPDALHYDREQRFAVEHDAVAPDIAIEMEKLEWCDILILQFPLWWFSVPAMLKGWIDRVFLNGRAYGGGRRYDAGGYRGRRAMVTTTTAAYPPMVGPAGLLGSLDVILWPIHNGTLAYAGFAVLPPFVGHAVAWIDDAGRAAVLDGYAACMRDIAAAEPLFFHPLADFGPDWTLRDGVEPRTAGQRRP
jgi:NAD(P)H dehydrogenase (quinone)